MNQKYVDNNGDGRILDMTIGRPTKPLNLTSEEREKLTMLSRRPESAQVIAMRARIVLECDEGLSNGAVAEKVRHWSHILQMAGTLSSESVGRAVG